MRSVHRLDGEPRGTVKVSVYIATSLDGFIARPNGDLDWLAGETPGEDYGYAAFMASVDVLVMGRKTFEKALTFEAWPYAGKRVLVLSTGTPAVPKAIAGGVEVISLAPRALVERLSGEGVSHVYLDGGSTIQRFLAAGLIDEITLTRIPVLIGEGIPLFGHLDRDVRLEHAETRAFESGFVQSRYRVTR